MPLLSTFQRALMNKVGRAGSLICFDKYHSSATFKEALPDRDAFGRYPVLVVGVKTVLCREAVDDHAVGLEDALCQLGPDLLAAGWHVCV